MIERLQRVLTWLEQLPPEVQEEAAAQLEILAETFEPIPNTMKNRARAKGRSLAGVWRDLAWDDEVEAFDRMRHATQPTPPLNYETLSAVWKVLRCGHKRKNNRHGND